MLFDKPLHVNRHHRVNVRSIPPHSARAIYWGETDEPAERLRKPPTPEKVLIGSPRLSANM